MIKKILRIFDNIITVFANVLRKRAETLVEMSYAITDQCDDVNWYDLDWDWNAQDDNSWGGLG